MSMNAFEALADQQATQATKRKWKRAEVKVVKSDADAPMVPTAQEREQREKQQLLREWIKWRREESDEMLEGPNGSEYRALLVLLSSLAPSSANALTSYVYRCTWVKKLAHKEKMIVLRAISDSIIRLRQSMGLAPFDDALPGEEPTAFELIRDYVLDLGLHLPPAGELRQ